jgi:hypothetical protein
LVFSGRLLAVDSLRLRRIARRQGGLFTRAQARACGFSAAQVRRRLGTGAWIAVRGPVLAEAGLPMTLGLADRAAQLALPGSVLAAFSAARAWNMPVPDRGPHLIVGRRTEATLAGVRVMRAVLDRYDVGVLNGVPLTMRARTVVDCLRLLDDGAATDLLDRALQRGWIRLDELVERARGLAGRRGAPRLARLVGAVGAGTRSAAERRMVELLVRGGVDGWEANVPIRDQRGLIGVGDVVFRGARVVIEVDGWAFHVTPQAFQRDRERQNRLVAAGWTVLRFTWRDLTERPGHVLGTVRRVVRVA